MTFDATTMKAEQERIANRVILRSVFSSLSDVTSIAAADISCNRGSNIGYAAVLLFTYPAIERVDEVGVAMEMKAPYVPGFLSFREGPLIEACRKTENEARRAHLRRAGIRASTPRRIGLSRRRPDGDRQHRLRQVALDWNP